VLVLDDVLATGGTLAATTKLIERAGWVVAGISVVLELSDLNGRDALPGRDVRSLLAV
jgi:adenine phosphoribosyltransferase